MEGGCRRLALLALSWAVLGVGMQAQRVFAPPPETPAPPPALPCLKPAPPPAPQPPPSAPPGAVAHLPAHETIRPQKLSPPPPDPLIAAHDLDVGTFYYNRGDYVGALSRFEDAIYNQPGAPEPYCRAGDAEFKMNRLLPARGDWQRCEKASEDSGKWGRHARQQLARHPAQPAAGDGAPR